MPSKVSLATAFLTLSILGSLASWANGPTLQTSSLIVSLIGGVYLTSRAYKFLQEVDILESGIIAVVLALLYAGGLIFLIVDLRARESLGFWSTRIPAFLTLLVAGLAFFHYVPIGKPSPPASPPRR